MKITVRNHAGIANRPIRFLKWKLYRLHRKFDSLIYAFVSIKKEGSGNSPVFEVLVKLGIAGPDIVIKHRSRDLEVLMSRSSRDAHRYLARKHN